MDRAGNDSKGDRKPGAVNECAAKGVEGGEPDGISATLGESARAEDPKSPRSRAHASGDVCPCSG